MQASLSLTCKKALPLLLATDALHMVNDTDILPVKILQVNNALSQWPNNIHQLTLYNNYYEGFFPPSLPQFTYGWVPVPCSVQVICREQMLTIACYLAGVCSPSASSGTLAVVSLCKHWPALRPSCEA